MKTPEKSNLGDTGERNKRGIFDKFSHDALVYLSLLVNNASDWFPRLKKDDLRQLIPLILAGMTAACQPTRGFEDQSPPSPTPIVEPYHPQPTPELIPSSPLKLIPTPESTPIATPGPTISGETLTINDSQLELKEFDGEEIAQLINASQKGWQVITNNEGKVSFFSGYAGEAGNESQVVVLAQGPKGYQWNPDNQIWENGNQVVIPDVLLPGGWNEEKQMAGPAHEAYTVFLFKDESGNYRIGVIYPPDIVAQIPDKSNLEILPDGSGLFVGPAKNYELQEGQQMIRDKDGNLRLINPDGSYLRMITSWSQVTSPNQLYQAGTFAGPFEKQPDIPYPPDNWAQELGITDYKVVDNQLVALQTIIDPQADKIVEELREYKYLESDILQAIIDQHTHRYIVAQATTNKEGKFTGWQRTLPFDVETGLVVPHPQETNPELLDLKKSDAPIPQFVNAMKMGGIEVDPQEVANNLQYQTITGADGEQYVIGYYNLNPNPKQTGETLEGPIPLVMWSEEEGWREVSLRKLADKLGIRIGSEFIWEVFQDKKLHDLFFNELNSVTIDYGIYWNNVEPKKGKFDFSIMDEQIREAQKYGMTLRGHALVFATASDIMPDWLKDGSFSKEELREILINHIKKVVTHGKEKGIEEWIVVNEPYLSNHRENDIFYKALGYDYIEIAFQAARETDPSATLIYNDTDNHSSDGSTTKLTRQMINRLKAKNLVDAVGVQAHIGDWVRVPRKNDVITTLQSYGIPVIVTEFDYNLHGISGTQAERYLKQAKVYKDFFSAALESGVCKDFIFWGIVDNYSWLEINNSDADPTLFDQNLQPKPSYYALTQTLLEYLDNSQ